MQRIKERYKMAKKISTKQERIILDAMQSFLLGCTGTFIFLCIMSRPPEDNYIVAVMGILSAVLSIITTSND
jgi:hypothetical protein